MTRTKKWILALLVVFAGGCEPSPNENFEHVLREVDSPDGTATAHLARNASAGAAGSLEYDVYLTQAKSTHDPERIFAANGDCDPDIEWRGGALLVIRYSARNCRIHDFHNIWRGRELETNLPSVEIMLDRVAPGEE